MTEGSEAPELRSNMGTGASSSSKLGLQRDKEDPASFRGGYTVVSS